MITLRKITWAEILPVWEEHLSNMTLETNSAMNLFNDRKLSEDTENPIWIDVHSYDLQNMETTPTFWGAFHNDKLVGVTLVTCVLTNYIDHVDCLYFQNIEI